MTLYGYARVSTDGQTGQIARLSGESIWCPVPETPSIDNFSYPLSFSRFNFLDR
jgi:hypothetical protein